MKLSAIVPTHDRPAELRRCLETLGAQDVPASQFEVVVLDDGSATDIGAVVAAVSADASIPIRYERQLLSGLNGARNRGVAVASGDVLAFLDDDTLVCDGWASSLLRAFDELPCAAVGGKVELSLAGPAPDWMAARRYYLAEYDHGPEPFWLEDQPVLIGAGWPEDQPLPVGANCAIRRSELERVGGFRTGLDRIARSLVSNGDTEFFRRLRAAGGRLRYEPAARVIHCVPADRLTLRYFNKRNYAQGISDELLRRLEGETPTLGDRLLAARQVGHAATVLWHDGRQGRGTVNAQFWAGYWAGRLMGAAVPLPPEAGANGSKSATGEVRWSC
jgi:glycosyltransferase involved in cell wall biosynthesis